MAITSPDWIEKHGIDESKLELWANVVLGWAGETYWRPSSWELAFIRLFSISDNANSEILLAAFPEPSTAMIIWKEGDIEELRRLAKQPVKQTD